MIRGLVLAGGKSSRFGSDKAFAFYKGARLIEHAVAALESVGLKPVIATRPGTEFPFLNCTTIFDKLPEQGPLGGLYTAFSVFPQTSFLVVTCDMPALTPTALAYLLARREPRSSATLYSIDGRLQPFPAIYEPSVYSAIRSNLTRGELSLHGLLGAVPSRNELLWEGESGVFANVNHREDLIHF